MSNGENGNHTVLPFVRREGTSRIDASEGLSGNTVNAISGNVFTLVQSQGVPKIYFERMKGTESCAPEFFRILLENRQINIFADIEDDITPETILNVQSETEGEYEITVADFVRLTIVDPNEKIDDCSTYLIPLLGQWGIKIDMQTNDEFVTETILSGEQIDTYKPEEIRAILDNGNLYMCEAYEGEKENNIGYGEAYVFDSKNHTVYLLDMMILALDDADNMDIGVDENVGFIVSYYEGNSTLITIIPPEMMEKVVFSALKRFNRLYENTSFEKARKHYFKHHTYIKMKDIIVVEDDDVP